MRLSKRPTIPLFVWLQSHGTTAMLIELAILAVLTLGAIATDEWWMEEAPTQPADPSNEQSPNAS